MSFVNSTQGALGDGAYKPEFSSFVNSTQGALGDGAYKPEFSNLFLVKLLTL